MNAAELLIWKLETFLAMLDRAGMNPVQTAAEKELRNALKQFKAARTIEAKKGAT